MVFHWLKEPSLNIGKGHRLGLGEVGYSTFSRSFTSTAMPSVGKSRDFADMVDAQIERMLASGR
jgi:hypothetical protein